MSDVLASLEGAESAAWTLLQRLANDGGLVALATAREGGGAAARMVVLRGAEPSSRTLTLWTHVGARKVHELGADERAEALFWLAESHLQIRATVTLSIERGEPRLWAILGEGSKRNYASPPPGTVLRSPDDFEPLPDEQFFAVIKAQVSQLDILSLAQTPHSRAIIDNSGSRWVVP